MSNANDKKIYDLEERTAKFGESIIDAAKGLSKSVITIPLISQLVRSGTSVGSNYCEADCAETKKDFEHKIGICKKESKETLAPNVGHGHTGKGQGAKIIMERS